MAVENPEAIRFVAEAIVIARAAQGDGKIIPISPCVEIDPEGKVTTCSHIDPTLKTLCKNPEGLELGREGLHCPKQEGILTFRNEY